MKAAVVTHAGETPVYSDFAEPQCAAGQQRVSVRAAAIHQVVKSRAAGKHYSSDIMFPFVAGIDGVGQSENGQRVYFVFPASPSGSMAERVAVPNANLIALPDGVSDVCAAAIANPGMSSWAALTRRAQLQPGETVLINGATGTSGTLAVSVARYLGAGKIIVTGRNRTILHALLSKGADAALKLDELPDALPDFFKQGVDVIIDYLWGDSALAILHAARYAESRPVRFVQVGSLSGQEILLHSHPLRSSALTLMGSGIGSVSVTELVACVAELLKATAESQWSIPCRPLPLRDVTSAWPDDDSRCRTVFTL